MKWLVIIAMTLFSAACASGNFSPAEQRLSNRVLAAIKYHDSHSLSDDDYDQISAYIAQGKTHWIELYPKFKRAPFLGVASFQEGLNIAMAYALPENPVAVLKFVDENNVGSVCGVPFIEPTQDETDHYIAKTSAALNTLTAGGYWQNRCLSALGQRPVNDPFPLK